jgi:hypothetical protein
MRVLLSTPDFPPRTGGLQLLLARLVESSSHRIRVVTIDAPGSDGSGSGIDVVRTPPTPDHRAEVVALNLETLRQVRAWRPQAHICGHVVIAPAARLLLKRISTFRHFSTCTRTSYDAGMDSRGSR